MPRFALSRNLTSSARVAALICAVALCFGSAGCGGSSSASSTKSSASNSTTQKGADTPRPAETVPGTPRASSRHSKSKTLRGRFPGSAGIRGRRRSPNLTEPAETPTLNPCTLVTAAQAQAIVGASLVSRKEAPLGPTCIFDFNGHSPITIAIESIPFAKTVGEMRKRTHVSIGGFQADCGIEGVQLLDVSLSRGRVLNVAAPCAIARGLAINALRHLHG